MDTQRLGGDLKGTASPAMGKSELPAARGRIAPLPTKTSVKHDSSRMCSVAECVLGQNSTIADEDVSKARQ
jgi:hypothetical protein